MVLVRGSACKALSYSRWCYNGDGALWSEYRQIYLKIRWREFQRKFRHGDSVWRQRLHSFDVAHLGGI
jgi:hypothetical protein